MDHNVPIALSALFIVTVFLAMVLLAAAIRSSIVLLLSAGWVALQSLLASSGFYAVTGGVPPRFFLAIGPPVLVVVALAVLPAGKRLMDGMDLRWTVLFHSIRILVEITLFWLYTCGQVAGVMTFEHGNLDILVGLTAPVAWLLYSRGIGGKRLLLAWNAVALLSLFNAVGRALLSAPLPFQKLAFDQPTVAILHAPFTLLPAFVVPAALFCHVAISRKVFMKT